MNTFAKIALASVGVVSTAVGAVALPTMADALNPNVVALEMGGYFDCEAGTYRPEFGSRLSGNLSPFFHHDGKEVTKALVEIAGPMGAFGTLAVAGQAADACRDLAANGTRVQETTPVAAAPAPVAPPVVAPVAQSVTYTGFVTFNGKSEKATITNFNNGSSYRVTWADGHEVTYTLINGFSVKIEAASRGGVVTSFGSWNSKTGDVVVTTENGTTVIPMAD